LKALGEIIVLFSSRDKFNLGMGYNCFYHPALPLRKKVNNPKKFEIVEKLNYY